MTLLTVGLITVPSLASAQPAPTSTIKVVRKAKPKPKPRARPQTTRAPSQTARAPGQMPRMGTPTAQARALVQQPAAPAALPRAPAPRADLHVSSPPPSQPKVWPWVTLAASVAAGVVGAIYLEKSISGINDDIEVTVKNSSNGTNTVELPPEVEARQRDVLTNGVVGAGLLGASLIGAVASLIGLN